MNNRPNVGKGDTKSSPGARGFKTEVTSLAGKQPDSVQRDRESRFSSVRTSDSGVQQNQAKNTEIEKNAKVEREVAGNKDSSVVEHAAAAETQKEKKFSGRCRLFVGNLPNDLSENEFQKFFERYGELNEVFLNASRGFGFIRLVSISF